MYVAVYARHSTNMQGSSTSDQLARCQKFCEAKGYKIAATYYDEAISGSHMINRPGIKELISDALEMRFQGVISEDLSRLSRDQCDVANFFKRMSFLDVWIETVAEGPINELHIGLKGTMNALYLKDLSDKTRRGMIAAVLKGGVPGGKIFGYDVVRKLDDRGEPVRGLRTVNEDQAITVRWIFDQYLEGKTLGQICAELNVTGIDPPKGKKWYDTVLCGTKSRQSGLLRNTLYKGVVTFNRMNYKKHPDTGKRQAVVNPREEWIEAPLPELAIIDTDIFERVQKLLETRSSRKREKIVNHQILTEREKMKKVYDRNREWRIRQSKSRNPVKFFSGRMFCKQHGVKIPASRGNIYTCPTSKCPNRQMRIDAIMPVIVAGALEIKEQDFIDAYGASEVVAERLAIETRRNEKLAEIATAQKKVTDVIDALGADARKTDQLRSYFEEKELAIRRLKYDLKIIERDLSRLVLPENIGELLMRYRKKLEILRTSPHDSSVNQTLRPALKRIEISANWNNAEGNYQRTCKVEVDVVELVSRLTKKIFREPKS